MQRKGKFTPKILAVASSGGHWVQLMRLRPAWQGFNLAYLTTEESYAEEVYSSAQIEGSPRPRFYTTISANRWQKARLARQLLKILWVIVKERPDVVCTTGAAPGYFAIRFGRLLGARTIWIDSIANAETLSLAGAKAGPFSDLWLTQWESLASPHSQETEAPRYWGAVV